MNDNLDTELEEDVDELFDNVEDEEDTSDADADEAPEAEDDGDAEEDPVPDDELGYDDDGNIIIGEDGETEAEEQDEETSEEAPAEEDTKPDEKDGEIERLRKNHSDREQLIRTALEKMGIKVEDDLDSALLRVIAESEGITTEEVQKRQQEEARKAEAERVYRQILLDKMVRDDLAALALEFPETKGFTKFEDIPNHKRFGELRDLGLSPREAYTAANPDRMREAAADSVRQQNINATKNHLQSNVPKASKDASEKISRGELEQYRELFPNLSDKEIIALYKKTK